MIVDVRCRLASVRLTLCVHSVFVFVNQRGKRPANKPQTENVGAGTHSALLLPFGIATETRRRVDNYKNTPQLQLTITKTV